MTPSHCSKLLARPLYLYLRSCYRAMSGCGASPPWCEAAGLLCSGAVPPLERGALRHPELGLGLRDLKGHFCQGSCVWRRGVVWEGRLFSKFHSCSHGTGGLIREIRQQHITCYRKIRTLPTGITLVLLPSE